MPEFEPADLGEISIKRPVYSATDEELDAELKEIAGANRTYETKDGEAGDGDMVVADFVGRIDGEAFEGGSADGSEIVIGFGALHPRLRRTVDRRQGR